MIEQNRCLLNAETCSCAALLCKKSNLKKECLTLLGQNLLQRLQYSPALKTTFAADFQETAWIAYFQNC